MNLLTNGFVNNCDRLFRLAEQFEADIVRVGAEKILCVNERESRHPCPDSGRITRYGYFVGFQFSISGTATNRQHGFVKRYGLVRDDRHEAPPVMVPFRRSPARPFAVQSHHRLGVLPLGSP
jgi:hypothetical protein